MRPTQRDVMLLKDAKRAMDQTGVICFVHNRKTVARVRDTPTGFEARNQYGSIIGEYKTIDECFDAVRALNYP